MHGGPELEAEEPLYGRAYLPRKFKIAVAHPGDNCVDVYTQDVGLMFMKLLDNRSARESTWAFIKER